MLAYALPFISLACVAVPPGAPAAAAHEGHVSARLICATKALVAGTTNEVGIQLTIDPGWHVYWDGANDTGLPLTAAWTLPEGWKAGAIRWPAPTRHLAPGKILDHIYTGSVTLIVPLEVPAAGAGSAATISADLDWLECSDVCVRAEQVAALTLPVVAKSAAAAASKEAGELEKARARLPKSLPKDTSAVALTWSDGLVVIDVAGARELVFYPGKHCAPLIDPIRDCEARGSRMKLEIGAGEGDGAGRLQGVLEVRGRGSPSEALYYEVDSRREP